MASLPEFAPDDTDHLLRSSSVVQEILYQPYHISYRTFDADGVQMLRLTFRPIQIIAGGQQLEQRQTLESLPGWTFAPDLNVVMVKAGAREVVIEGR
jgi:hypothetical protein